MEGPCSGVGLEEEESTVISARRRDIISHRVSASIRWMSERQGEVAVVLPLSGYPPRETTRHFHSHKPEQRLN